MTFEEIIEKLKKHDITKLFNSYTVIKIIEDLRKEYVPKIEMTKEQKDTLIYIKKEGLSFVDTITDTDGGVLIHEFDSYWLPLTEEQLMRAWVYPKSIKVEE